MNDCEQSVSCVQGRHHKTPYKVQPLLYAHFSSVAVRFRCGCLVKMIFWFCQEITLLALCMWFTEHVKSGRYHQEIMWCADTAERRICWRISRNIEWSHQHMGHSAQVSYTRCLQVQETWIWYMYRLKIPIWALLRKVSQPYPQRTTHLWLWHLVLPATDCILCKLSINPSAGSMLPDQPILPDMSVTLTPWLACHRQQNVECKSGCHSYRNVSGSHPLQYWLHWTRHNGEEDYFAGIVENDCH